MNLPGSSNGQGAGGPGLSPQWLNLYQYKKTWVGGYKSAVNSPQFFFSPQGRLDPREEFKAAQVAFLSNEKVYGIQKRPAACVFPARKRVLERLLSTPLPQVNCPELNEWLNNLHADKASLVFVGAYSGNPASLLGHTFLRFYNSEGEASRRQGMDLLSNSVGFSAIPDPTDNRLVYMVKGLTGEYPGFFEVEPHYMKVGLYNNSESRDLWDVPLALSKDEVELLTLHLWELTFNAQFEYYFLDENCSYRLIKMLELARPSLNISRDFSFIVLPAETVRRVQSRGLVTEELRFRSSIKRRRDLKLSLLNFEQRKKYAQAQSSLQLVREINDPTLIDALIDYWTFKNYQKKTKLTLEESTLMEASFSQAARIQSPSHFRWSDSDIRHNLKLQPPFEGHKPRWLKIQAGEVSAKPAAGLEFRSGVHSLWQDDRGYEDVSSIEYLGGSLTLRKERPALWDLVLVKARSIETLSRSEFLPSWGLDILTGNNCPLCQHERPQLQISGGLGAGWKGKRALGYALGGLETHAWAEAGPQGVLAPGLIAGAKFNYSPLSLLIEGSHFWWRNLRKLEFSTQLSFAKSLNSSYQLEWQHGQVSAAARKNSYLLSFTRFFD